MWPPSTAACGCWEGGGGAGRGGRGADPARPARPSDRIYANQIKQGAGRDGRGETRAMRNAAAVAAAALLLLLCCSAGCARMAAAAEHSKHGCLRGLTSYRTVFSCNKEETPACLVLPAHRQGSESNVESPRRPTSIVAARLAWGRLSPWLNRPLRSLLAIQLRPRNGSSCARGLRKHRRG
jgi:hypothetical protein